MDFGCVSRWFFLFLIPEVLMWLFLSREAWNKVKESDFEALKKDADVTVLYEGETQIAQGSMTVLWFLPRPGVKSKLKIL